MRKIMELSREFGVECWYLSKWISVKHSLAARDFSENWLTVSVRWVLMLLWITPHCHCGGKGRERAGARPQTASSSCHKCAILGYLLQAPPTIQDKMGSFWHLKAIKWYLICFSSDAERNTLHYSALWTFMENIFRILLNCYGLDKMEEISR